MKNQRVCLFILSLVFFCCGASHATKTATSPPTDKSFYDAMRDLLQFIYRTQKNNDQFNFDKYELKENTTLLSCNAFLSGIILTGFSSFNYKFVQDGKSSGTDVFKFSLETSYGELKLIANKYRLNFDILTMLPVYGEGKAGILFGDIKNVLNVTLNVTKAGYLEVGDISLDFDLPKIMTSFSGLLDTDAQSDLISSVLSFILPNAINDIKPQVLKFANPLAMYGINKYLAEKQVTLQWLIQFIESYVG